MIADIAEDAVEDDSLLEELAKAVVIKDVTIHQRRAALELQAALIELGLVPLVEKTTDFSTYDYYKVYRLVVELRDGQKIRYFVHPSSLSGQVLFKMVTETGMRFTTHYSSGILRETRSWILHGVPPT